jgi:hypothetical protein
MPLAMAERTQLGALAAMARLGYAAQTGVDRGRPKLRRPEVQGRRAAGQVPAVSTSGNIRERSL